MHFESIFLTKNTLLQKDYKRCCLEKMKVSICIQIERERINERVSNKNAAMQSYNLKTVPAVNLKNSRKEVVKNL